MGLIGRQQTPLIRNANEVATRIIRQAILEGRLKPGDRLKEEELAQELGISRTPVRESLLILQSEGLVEAAPNRGATVRSYVPSDLEDMYNLRAVLESYAARQAATRVTAKEVKALERSCDKFETLQSEEDVLDLIKENLHFHNIIIQASGSERIAQMLRNVIELPLVYKSYFWYSPQQKMMSLHYHRQLTSALQRRDVERADLVMKEHVLEARDFLLRKMEDKNDQAISSAARRGK